MRPKRIHAGPYIYLFCYFINFLKTLGFFLCNSDGVETCATVNSFVWFVTDKFQRTQKEMKTREKTKQRNKKWTRDSCKSVLVSFMVYNIFKTDSNKCFLPIFPAKKPVKSRLTPWEMIASPHWNLINSPGSV